jgi:hypothetical protein
MRLSKQCVSMSLTTYNLLLVQKKQTRHPHSLLMSHVSLCLLEVVNGDIETLETGFYRDLHRQVFEGPPSRRVCSRL